MILPMVREVRKKAKQQECENFLSSNKFSVETTSNIRSNFLLRINCKVLYLCCLQHGLCQKNPICSNWGYNIRDSSQSSRTVTFNRFLCLKSPRTTSPLGWYVM